MIRSDQMDQIGHLFQGADIKPFDDNENDLEYRMNGGGGLMWFGDVGQSKISASF